MKKLAGRMALITFFPLLILWTILSRVWGEVKTIPFYCWNDLRGEWADAQKFWRNPDLPIR